MTATRNLASAIVVLALLLAAGSARTAAAEASSPADPGALDRFAPLSPPTLRGEDRVRVEAGETVVHELEPSDPDGFGVIAFGLVSAPPDELWAVMSDCEHQDEFLPRITHASVRDRDGDSHTCDLVVDLPFPIDDARTATRQRVRRLPDGGWQRYWELAPGDWSYHRNSGSWTVHPWADGKRSLLVNRMDLLPKSGLPVWILRAAQSDQAPASFEAIRRRVLEVREAARRAAE